MSRLANSWELTKTSWGVVKKDKELLWMPILSFLASAVAVLGIAGIGISLWPQLLDGDSTGVGAEAFVLVFGLYLALAFITVYFGAAVVAAAKERLDGGDPTVGSAFKAANQHLGRIFLWSIVVATVNVLFQVLREAAKNRGGILGHLMVTGAGVAWNLATYFMVPVLVFEGKPLGDSIRRSGAMFKKTWGESVIGQYGLGWIAGAATMLVLVVGFMVGSLLGGFLGDAGTFIGLALMVIGVVVITALFAVLQGVYKAALYRFATEGSGGEGFTQEQLGGAWGARPQRGQW